MVHPEPMNDPLEWLFGASNPSLCQQLHALDWNNPDVGKALVNPDGTVAEVNNKFGKMIGYAPNELREVHFREFTHPSDLKKDVAELERLLAGEVEQYEIEKRYVHQITQEFVAVKLRVEAVWDEMGEKIQLLYAQVKPVTLAPPTFLEAHRPPPDRMFWLGLAGMVSGVALVLVGALADVEQSALLVSAGLAMTGGGGWASAQNRGNDRVTVVDGR